MQCTSSAALAALESPCLWAQLSKFLKAVAIEQMREKNYASLYSLSKKQIYLVGIGFTLQKKGISDYLIEPLLK